MSCIEVQAWIAAGMEEAPNSAPEDLAPQRREHFADCPQCRRELLAADPTLLFLGSDRLEVNEAEVESVRQTVRAMRRTRRLERPEWRAGRRSAGRVQRAVAAGFLLAAVLVLPAGERSTEGPRSDVVRVAGDAGSTAFFEREGTTLVSDLESPSVLENLDRPGARVYQLTENDLAVVMIVDETLDL